MKLLVIGIGITLILWTINAPVALDHIKVDTSKFEDDNHAS